jgi:hypothetical protein
LSPGKASEKTPKGVIPPSLCKNMAERLEKKKCTASFVLRLKNINVLHIY